MNFNLIPDELVNKFQQADDEAAIIDILTIEKTKTNITIECNPEIIELKVYCILPISTSDSFLKFMNKETFADVSKNKLASDDDYKLVLRLYGEDKEYINFGIVNTIVKEDSKFPDNTVGFDVTINIHTFDVEKAELIYLEDAEYAMIHDHDDKYVKINCYDETDIAEYNL